MKSEEIEKMLEAQRNLNNRMTKDLCEEIFKGFGDHMYRIWSKNRNFPLHKLDMVSMNLYAKAIDREIDRIF